MKKIIILLVAIFFLIPSYANATMTVLMYEQFGCNCCSGWEKYMRDLGVNVIKEEKSQHEMAVIKREAGVPEALWSCHTSISANLIIEGHVPLEVILEIEIGSNIVGVSVPSMRMGSPGMEGNKPMAYDVYAWDKYGKYWFYKTVGGK
ncbi:MAG: DUF411 domain-containing protein [Planctomycetota bacterium]|jgi:hypothetical protein